MPSIQSAGPVDPALIDDLVAASRILAKHGVLDAWGHVSMRHPKNPERYLLSRARAPALVSAEDIMEFDLNSDPVDQQGRRMFLERYIHGEAFRAQARRQCRGAQPFADRDPVHRHRRAAARGLAHRLVPGGRLPVLRDPRRRPDHRPAGDQ